jgi:predicted DsbA family dithiol-disulfide isomerase
MPEELRARFGGMNERLRQMAAEARLPMIVPERIPSSRRALEAAEFARENGLHEPFHQAIFRKFYGEGQDLHDWSVLRAAAEEVGLDAERIERQTSSGRYSAAIVEVSDRAKSLGIQAIPAFIIAGRLAIIGLQPLEVFRRTMSRVREG